MKRRIVFVHNNLKDAETFLESLSIFYHQFDYKICFNKSTGTGSVDFSDGSRIVLVRPSLTARGHRCHTLIVTEDVLDMFTDDRELWTNVFAPMMAIQPHLGSFGYPVVFTYNEEWEDYDLTLYTGRI